MIIVHYPWRVGIVRQRQSVEIPLPEDDTISPALGAFVIGDDGCVSEELQGPSVDAGSGQIMLTIKEGDHVVERNYSTQAFQYQNCEPESDCRKLHYGMTDIFIRMSDFLYQYREKSGDLCGDKTIAEACRDLSDYLGSEKDFAPESLIVRIARETPTALKDIVENPRVALRREHQQVPLDRMQEVDVYSLQDYARRPGRTAAMKAGHRQRLMAVVRNETADTYENRIVKSFIELSAKSARQYQEEMCSRCPRRKECATKDPLREGLCKSERVKTVSAFDLFCQMLLKSAKFADVPRMSEPKTQPNYVLQQNPRYLNIWKFYQRLLRQENIESDVWIWRRRTWADLMRLFVLYFWNSRISKMENFAIQTSNKPFMIKRENAHGTWLCSDPFEDAAVFKTKEGFVTLSILNSDGLMKLTGNTNTGLAKLNADFYIVSKSAVKGGSEVSELFRARILPVWCFCPDKSWENDIENKANAVCKEIKVMLDDWGQNTGYDFSQSLVLFPGNDMKLRVSGDGRHRFYSVNLFNPPNVDKFFTKLESWIERMIK